MSKKSRRIVLSTMVAPAAVFALVACGSADVGGPAQDDPGGVAEPETAETPAEPGSTGDDQLSDDEGTPETADTGIEQYSSAIAAAEAEVGDGAFAVQLDRVDTEGRDNAELTFEIDVVQGTTVFEVDILDDGSARIEEEDRRDVDEQDQQEIDAAELTMLEAIEAALAHQDGVIEEVELDTEDNVVVWEIDYREETNRDLRIDATTGAVTETGGGLGEDDGFVDEPEDFREDDNN